MHNQIMGSAGMDQEAQLVADNTYTGENWIDMGAYHHQHATTTMTDFGSSFGYASVSAEPLQRMPPPPPGMPQETHTSLPMIPCMLPTHWPSMLTSNHGYPTPPPPQPPPVVAIAMPSAAAPTSAKTAKLPAITTTQPRKTLTDDDRRRMCQYADAHPQAKQTDIGRIFGVERSTVSKVLRNREKYMAEDGTNTTSSPVVKRPKTKAGSGGSGGASASANGSVWREKLLRQKNGKLPRRASETSIPDAARTSPKSRTPSQPSSTISPSSPLPLSAHRSDDDAFAFSPDTDMAGFVATDRRQQQQQQQDQQQKQQKRQQEQEPQKQQQQQHVQQRPRSQTFPALDLEYMDQTVASPQQRLLHRSASSGSLASVSGTTAAAASSSTPVSPSQEDARKAADTLLSYIQSGAGGAGGLMVDHNEYVAVVRLTEKLRIHQAQHQLAAAVASRPGGLSRIPEGDSEMPNARRPS